MLVAAAMALGLGLASPVVSVSSHPMSLVDIGDASMTKRGPSVAKPVLRPSPPRPVVKHERRSVPAMPGDVHRRSHPRALPGAGEGTRRDDHDHHPHLT